MRLVSAFFIFTFSGSVLGDLKWCIAPPNIHVLQNETCGSLGMQVTTEFNVFGMQGEEESQQLLIDTRGWGSAQNMTNKVSLTFDTFQSANGDGKALQENPKVLWWQVGYVFCKATTRYVGSGGGWRPDPLLAPQTDGSVILESEITQPLWLSVKIPSDFSPGVYKSSVVVSITGKDAGESVTIPVSLTVWDIQLPPLAKAKFPAIFSFNKNVLNLVYGDQAGQMTAKFEDVLIDQRMGGNNLYSTHQPANITEAVYLADKGVQWINLFNVNGAAASTSLINDKLTNNVKGSCPNFTEDAIQKVIQILTPAITEAQRMNVLDNLFVYGFDEAPETCQASIKALYTALKQKWKDLRTVATVNWLPDTSTPMDVWVLQYEEYNQDKATKWIQAGKQQWWYHCIEPSNIQYLNTFIERPQLQTRLLFWLASAHEVGGWLYYSTVMWNRYPKSTQVMNRLNGTARTDFDPANYIWYPRTDIFANGDGNFLYPGSDGPIATVRLHNLRDGFEDAEMFRQISLEKVGPIVQSLVRSPTDFTLDSNLFENQRKKAAQEVINYKRH